MASHHHLESKSLSLTREESREWGGGRAEGRIESRSSEADKSTYVFEGMQDLYVGDEVVVGVAVLKKVESNESSKSAADEIEKDDAKCLKRAENEDSDGRGKRRRER